MKAPYFICGPFGASKTVNVVNFIVGYLNEGRPVATNIDVYPERMKLTKAGKHTPIVRLPDEPRWEDVNMLGVAYDKEEFGYNEDRNGILALDETAFFLNSRDWNRSGRAQIIKILRLIRKRGWNCFFITQDIDSIDSQIRNALCKTIGWCQSSDDYMGIASGNFLKTVILMPFKFIASVIIKGILRVPKIHIVSFFAGQSVTSGIEKGKAYAWGWQLYDSYSTDQEFDDGHEFLDVPVRDQSGFKIKVAYEYQGEMKYDFVPEAAAYTNPMFQIQRETVYRDMRASYSILPACYLDYWYPDGVPDRPLTAKAAKKKEAELKKKLKSGEAITSVQVRPPFIKEPETSDDSIEIDFGKIFKKPVNLLVWLLCRSRAHKSGWSVAEVAFLYGYTQILK